MTKHFNPSNLECELIFGDIHVPYEDKNAIKAIHQYIAWRSKTKGVLPVTGITSVGDLVESAAVSRHNKGKRGLQEGLRIKTEFDAGYQLLSTWRELLGSNGKITLVEGNHEYRIQAYLDENPELNGLLSVPGLLRLEELGVKWVPNWSDKAKLHRIGNIYVGHGFKTNEYHAGAHAKFYHACFVYGHTHAIQTYTLALVAKNKVVEAVNIGWLGDIKQSTKMWTKGDPNKWETAFMLVYVDRRTGWYQHYLVRVHDGVFVSPEGVVFDKNGVVK